MKLNSERQWRNNMKQFDLQEYLKNPSRKIVTRNGCAARILCTDRDYYNYPVVALVQVQLHQGQLREDPYCYTKDGLYLDHSETQKDLFFAPEKKEGWVNMFKDQSGDPQLGIIYTSKEVAETMAKQCGRHPFTTIKIEWEE